MTKLGFALLVTTVAVALAAPAAAAPSSGRGATASSGFVSIPVHHRLKARRKLRIPIRCAVVCNAKSTFTVVLPGPNLGPRTLAGTLDPASPQDLVITLNDPATQSLKAHFRSCKLRIKVRATDTTTGAVALAHKVLRFRSS